MADRIELSEILRYVSSELSKADAEARESGAAVMEFKECTLEFAVTAEKEAGGGLKVWVLNLSGGAKKSESHTITVTMKALGTVVAPTQSSSVDDRPYRRQTTPGGAG